MKKLILIVLLILPFSKNFANQAQYEKEIKKGLELLNGSQNSQGYLTSAEYFKRVEIANPNEWLSPYYVSFSTLLAGIFEEDNNMKDELFDRALAVAEKIKVTETNGSELYALLGYIQFMKISVKPMPRAVTGTGKAMELIKKSIELNPENPRPYYVQGQHTFYTPAMFGGGLEKAKSLLAAASNRYKKDPNKNTMMPEWGNTRNTKLLEKCQ